MPHTADHASMGTPSGNNNPVTGEPDWKDPANKKSDNVIRRTYNPKNKNPEATKSDPNNDIIKNSGESNIFNNYRSITYSFTLAALEKRHLDHPESYRADNYELELIILESGGRGDAQMKRTVSTKDSDVTPALNPDTKGKTGTASDKKKARSEKRLAATNAGQKTNDFFAGFNTQSPGRFDMFMENVEIESIASPSEKTNTTTAMKIKFDVIEPYSINGFIEALHVASIAAGNPSYQNAPFLLKLEFWGYDDTEEFPDPVKIPRSTRYYPISICEANIEITEKGTLYRCNAVPYNERSFGHPNMVKKPIKMQGKDVGNILRNLFEALDAASKEIQEIENKEAGVTSKEWDRYEIKFPSWDTAEGWLNDKENKIAKSKMGSVLTSPVLVGMNKPEDAAANPPAAKAGEPESVKFKPGESVIQFDQDTNISEIITGIVRDSEYSIDILKALNEKGSGVPDQYGFVDYWMIRVETTNSTEINELGKRPFQKFTYLVSPYKVHYTRIPGYGRERINEKDLEKISNREYNFIYTGKNIDVLNFKLNFNNLFFEAVPVNMGNKPSDAKSGAAANSNFTTPKLNSKPTKVDGKNRESGQVPDPAVKIISTKLQTYGGNAAQPSEEPFQILARTMHNSVINSKASMLTGELEILGDPFYLAGAGAGNWNPKPSSRGKTLSGEVNHIYGAILITINFRNPEDINSFDNGGMFKFDSNRVPFSGVYQVTTILSTFKDGIFKQKLDILRMPGQVLDSDLRSSDPRDALTTEPKEDAQVVPDQTRAMSPENRASTDTLENALSKRILALPVPRSVFNPNIANWAWDAQQAAAAEATSAASPTRTGGAANGGLGGATEPTITSVTPVSVVLPLDELSAYPTSPVNTMDDSDDFYAKPFVPPPVPNTISTPVISSNLPAPTILNGDTSRLNSGLTSLSEISALGTNQIASLYGVANISNAATADLISKSLAATAIGAAGNISNLGSGIGKGASVLITPRSSISSVPTANDIKQGLNIDSSILPAGIISKTAAFATSLPNSLTGGSADNLISGIGSKINSLRSLATDPTGIGARLGINPSKLVGLAGSLSLQSKLPAQVNDLIKNIPKNVNLKQAANQGLVLDYIPSGKIANIPATPPLSKAPIAIPDTNYVKTVIASGGMTALQNLYGVNSSAKLSTNLVPNELIALGQQAIPNSGLNSLRNLTGLTNAVDVNIAKDKLGSFQNQLSGLTGQIKIPDVNLPGSVTSQFSAKTLGSSPLTNLINRTNTGNT